VELQEHVLNQTMTIGAARIAIHLSKEAQLELAKQKRVTQADAAALLRTDLGDNLDLPDLPEIVTPDAGPSRSITLTATEWAQAESGGVTINMGDKQIKVEVLT